MQQVRGLGKGELAARPPHTQAIPKGNCNTLAFPPPPPFPFPRPRADAIQLDIDALLEDKRQKLQVLEGLLGHAPTDTELSELARGQAPQEAVGAASEGAVADAVPTAGGFSFLQPVAQEAEAPPPATGFNF